MFRNYLTIAIRNLWRHKLHSFIHITGLAIGISACLVIFLIVDFELGFDRFWKGGERIYRVYSTFSGDFDGINRGISLAIPGYIREEFTGLESLCSFYSFGSTVSIEEKKKKLERNGDVVLADPDFFTVFPNFKWLSGSPQEALSKPFQVVLTERKARLYFGVDDPLDALGREIHYRDSLAVTVSGIVADLPNQTDLDFGDFISKATIHNSWLKDQFNEEDWGSTNSSTQLFVKLAPGVAEESIRKQLDKVSDRYLQQNKNVGWEVTMTPGLQSLGDLHYNTEMGIFDHSRQPAHRPTLYALGLIALLLLLIAAVNFINLETAQAVRRAREVGVRKVLGSNRLQLMGQFLGETFLITLISMLIALQLVRWALWYFEEFIPKGLVFQPDARLFGFLALTAVLVALLAGAYPAFVLSAYRPVLALKDQTVKSGKTTSAHLRRALIVFQFVIAQVLIFGTLTIGRQTHYLLHTDMGFDREAIVNLDIPWNYPLDQRQVLAAELRRLPEVKMLSLHQAPPAENGYNSSVIKYENGKEVLIHNVFRKYGDTAFIALYNMPLVAGRNVLPSDTLRELVINETYAQQLGFKEPAQALGAELLLNDRRLPVVGVIRDFHIQPLHHQIPPVAIGNEESNFYFLSLKLRTAGLHGEQVSAIVKKVEAVWKKIYPDLPFDYQFFDEQLASFYESEQRAGKLMRTATGVAILISCLGLLGLVSYTSAQRTREIGIRKVLGASSLQIVHLLTGDFLRLILLAGLIAFPIAWYLMQQWLDNFAYRIDLSWWMFLLAGILALLVALLTVSSQALKAALANPSKSLKYE